MTEIAEHQAHVGRKFLDVSRLPTVVFGHRDPLWWGVWLLIAIEGTMFALLATSYFYLRGNESEWPPTGASNAPLPLSGTTVVLLLISCIPIWFAYRAALDGNLRVIRWGMLIDTLLSIVIVIVRWFELEAIQYKWNSHAYGSIVWAIYFMHSFHLVSGAVENIVLTALLYKGPVEKKFMVDIRLSAIYWWFVALAWIPFWIIFVLDEGVLR